jgi:hypothetical protein
MLQNWLGSLSLDESCLDEARLSKGRTRTHSPAESEFWSTEPLSKGVREPLRHPGADGALGSCWRQVVVELGFGTWQGRKVLLTRETRKVSVWHHPGAEDVYVFEHGNSQPVLDAPALVRVQALRGTAMGSVVNAMLQAWMDWPKAAGAEPAEAVDEEALPF